MMLGSFLDRMIPPGNFIVVASKTANGHLFNRFYSRVNFDDAAKFCRRLSNQGRDTWFAPASYRDAVQQDDGSFKGSRRQTNVEQLKALWLDADIARPGDGKDPADVFADLAEVVVWTKGFSQATGMPLPNVWVRSGYGVHLYWTFATPLSRAEWQPHADALKAAVVAHGARGCDVAVIADAARILRPPETFNYKDPTAPAPCTVLIDQPDYANTQLTLTTSSAAPSQVFQGQTSLAANARAGLTAQPRDLAVIAQGCAQVRRSLDEGGEHDGRQLWRMLLNLAHFCEETRTWAHRLGDMHKTYDPAKVEAECDLIEQEHQSKKFGPPTCATLNGERPGVCDQCPLHGKGKSPYTLGVVASSFNPEDLPNGFRRSGLGIEIYADKMWLPLLAGDISKPLLEEIGREYRLNFTYTETGGKQRKVAVTRSELNNREIRVRLAAQGLAINYINHANVPRLLMGWIDKLVTACAYREALPAFGWLHAKELDGFAVGGEFYNSDGSTHESAGPLADESLLRKYKPVGDLDVWRDAAAFVISDVPELHLALAVSFAAPLMELAGETGGCLSFVGESGTGKSSVFRAGAAVWGHPITTMAQLNDTTAYQIRVAGLTQAMPVFWDEVLIAAADKFAVKEAVEHLHLLTQGREKGRLTADIRVRDQGTWQTIVAMASNRSIAELIAAQTDTHKGATLLRVLDVTLRHTLPPTAGAEKKVNALRQNYGAAGRIYAQWLATHQTEARAKLDQAHAAMEVALKGYKTDERFYAGIAKACVAGAAIAKKLGLVPSFDVRGIVETLVGTIRQARHDRVEVEPLNLHQVLDAFLNAHANGLLITAEHRKSGPLPQAPLASTAFTQYPKPAGQWRDIPCVHLAVEDGRMRIDKTVLREWLASQGRSARTVFEAMKNRWNARGATSPTQRARLGAGERWGTPGEVNIVELDLKQRELRHLLVDYAATTGSSVLGGNVVAMPRKPQPQTPQPPPGTP